MPQVDEWCGVLVQRLQLLQERGENVWPDGTVAGCYGFAHALYQEVIYNRLTAGQRVHLHRRIGECQEKAYGPQTGDIAAELAMHFERGRDYWRAIVYLQQGADNALQRYANAEGIEQLTTALQLLKTLPATPERAQQELDILSSLGPALTATRGYGAVEVEQTYRRAHQLCQQMGDARRLFAVLRGLAAFYQQRGELQTANTLAEQLLDLARRAQDPTLLLRGYQTHGSTLFYRGELALARRLLEQGMTFDQPRPHRSPAWRSGLNTSVVCLGHMAWDLWLLGYPEQALQKSHAALTLAQELSHPHSLAYASHFMCVIHQFRREVPLTQERAETVFSLSTEYGLAFWCAYGTIMQGWASAQQGQGEAGITLIHKGLAALRETGGELGRTYFLALLAETCSIAGHVTEGLGALTEALATMEKSAEHFYAAELHRLKGELLKAECGRSQSPSPPLCGRKLRCADVVAPCESSSFPPPTQSRRVRGAALHAEACFQQALAVARHQQARSLELRAAMSLARLWQQQGKHQAAHCLLTEVYAWFDEGFDTTDLREARALLAALA